MIVQCDNSCGEPECNCSHRIPHEHKGSCDGLCGGRPGSGCKPASGKAKEKYEWMKHLERLENENDL